MKAAILGTGGIGLGTAALLASNETSVSVWGRSASGMQALLDGQPILASGAVTGRFSVIASQKMAEVVHEADVIIVTVSGAGLKSTLDLLAPWIMPCQLVVISAHLSFAALYLSRLLGSRGVKAEIVALASTLVTARRSLPGTVEISSIRKQVTAAALGPDAALQKLSMWFPAIIFKPVTSMLAVMLNNVNPTSHIPTALCNLARMEYGEQCGSYRGISPAVAHLIEALDSERIEVAARVHVPAHSLAEHWNRSFDIPLGPIAIMAAQQNERRHGGPAGPISLDHRFVTEDVPFGIVPNIALGQIAGVNMSMHEACVGIFNTLYRRDFAAENDLLPEIAIEGCSVDEISDLCRSGFN